MAKKRKRIVISKFAKRVPKGLEPAFQAGVLGTFRMAGEKIGR